MGYYIKYEELQLVEQSILNQIANWNNQLEELSKKLIDIAEMEEIKGNTAISIRNYIYEVHITLIGSLNQLLKEYETRLILYANGYYELDSDARAEISQDELEEQMTNLKREQENFSDTSNSVNETLRSISDIIYLSGPPSYGVKSNYNTIYYEVRSLKDKIGEYEESHLKSDFNTIEEMVSTLSQIIKGQIGKEDIAITTYKAGTIGKIPAYETLLDIYAEQEAYLNESSKDLEKAVVNFIERQKIMEEIYGNERIGEGLTQTAGGAVSFLAGAGLILTIATGGLAGPVIFGLAVVGTCSMLYGLSNSAEGGDNLFYGLKGDGTSIAVNPIRDSIFQSNPELYYQIGNTSTILATMGTPIAGGVSVEQVIATQTKGIISGAVGSAASNALIDRYDMNPYMAMGIGIGIGNITYEGINYIGNMDYVNGFSIKPVEVISVDNIETYTSFRELMSPEEKANYNKYWDAKGFEEFYRRTSGVLTETEIIEAYDAMKNGDYVKMASYFDFSSPEDGAVFWSGNKFEAVKYAEKINGTIMEGTSGGKVFDDWDWLKYQYPEWGTETPLDQREIWKAVSAKYAKGASGKVTYVHPEDYTGWVWDNVELDIIEKRMRTGFITELKEVFVHEK